MNMITQDILDDLKTGVFSYTVSVTRSYDASSVIYPRLVIIQADNASYLKSADNELLSLAAIQIEIYAQDTVDGSGKVVSKHTVADQLMSEIDTIIQTGYQLNRDMVVDDPNYKEDVIRRIMRYSGAVSQDNYTYRL